MVALSPGPRVRNRPPHSVRSDSGCKSVRPDLEESWLSKKFWNSGWIRNQRASEGKAVPLNSGPSLPLLLGNESAVLIWLKMVHSTTTRIEYILIDIFIHCRRPFWCCFMADWMCFECFEVSKNCQNCCQPNHGITHACCLISVSSSFESGSTPSSSFYFFFFLLLNNLLFIFKLGKALKKEDKKLGTIQHKCFLVKCQTTYKSD